MEALAPPSPARCRASCPDCGAAIAARFDPRQILPDASCATARGSLRRRRHAGRALPLVRAAILRHAAARRASTPSGAPGGGGLTRMRRPSYLQRDRPPPPAGCARAAVLGPAPGAVPDPGRRRCSRAGARLARGPHSAPRRRRPPAPSPAGPALPARAGDRGRNAGRVAQPAPIARTAQQPRKRRSAAPALRRVHRPEQQRLARAASRAPPPGRPSRPGRRLATARAPHRPRCAAAGAAP